MVATREGWISAQVITRNPSPEQMLAFFGIPPHAAGELNDNIDQKRRRWNRLSNSGNARGRETAEQVLALIQDLAVALKRGVTQEIGGGAETEIPASVFETLDELRRILFDYVSAGDYDEAIRVAREAISRWQNADAAAELAWVIMNFAHNVRFAQPDLVAEGIQAARLATREQPGEVRNWESLASLLLSSAKAQDAVAAIDQAESATGGRASAMLYLHRAAAMAELKKPDEAMTAAVRAVSRAESGNAAAIRGEVADILITWAAEMLPIRSAADLTRYTELVGVAAWCSYGVPEAEDKVRAYRMWAANAGKRVFVGSDRMRSFLAVITGFISLPIHNYVRSRPAWQVFNEGQGKNVTEAFFIVAAPAYVQKIHNVSLGLSFQSFQDG
jgi:tetratricopeptide (TPR) repeat protein